MTAIKTNASSLASKATPKDDVQLPVNSLTPSATEAEAKKRFVSALTKGVETLSRRGHGWERASAELLNEIADGCSPDEDEVFQTMETLGISLEDATKVMTVATAFRKAQSTKSGSAIEAIDDLTNRLNLAGIGQKVGSASRSSSPSPSVGGITSSSSNIKLTELVRNESTESTESSQQTRPSTAVGVAKKGQRPSSRATNKSQKEGRGRKRALTEQTAPEKRDSNVMLGTEPNGKAAAAKGDDLDVKEKMLNAKLSKAEGKKPKSTSSARAKSPEGGLGTSRGSKRTAALHVEESQTPKRARTRSQTEESIPAI